MYIDKKVKKNKEYRKKEKFKREGGNEKGMQGTRWQKALRGRNYTGLSRRRCECNSPAGSSDLHVASHLRSAFLETPPRSSCKTCQFEET